MNNRHSSSSNAKLFIFTESIDVVLLGMGEDGHTSSYFPHVPSPIRAINGDAKQLCIAVSAPTARHLRMTLQPPPTNLFHE